MTVQFHNVEVWIRNARTGEVTKKPFEGRIPLDHPDQELEIWVDDVLVDSTEYEMDDDV